MTVTPVRSAAAQPVLAGLVCGLVGFTSSFAVVLTGLAAVGATPQQAASGLLVLCLTMGIGSLVFSLRTRMPVTMAWSTPGAALLGVTMAPAGGFGSAVGAFVLCGVLIAVTALVRPLATAVRAIPVRLANAMLAGVLLTICLQPVVAVVDQPWAIGPVILVWLIMMRLARRWAVPTSVAAAVIVMVATGSFTRLPADLAPSLTLVVPQFDLVTAISIGVPLYLVTMTSQNIAGLAVLGSFGYHPPFSPPIAYTGVASAVGALGGGHAINLAALSAALAAGPEAGPDRDRRWIAGVACGAAYIGFAPFSGPVAAVAGAAPPGLVVAVAGLALIGTFAAAAGQALSDPGPARPHTREAAAVTFIVAAAGIAPLGIGAAFWGLAAGLIYLGVFRLGARS